MNENKKHGYCMVAYSAYIMANCINTEHLQNALALCEKTTEYYKTEQTTDPLKAYNTDNFLTQFADSFRDNTLLKGLKPGVLVSIGLLDCVAVLGDDNEIYIQDLLDFRYLKAEKKEVQDETL